MSVSKKEDELNSSREKGKTEKPENGSKQVTSIGSGPSTLKETESAAENASTAVLSKTDQGGGLSKGGSKSTLSPAEMLAILQTDFFDLQMLGFKVAILARNNILYASIELPGSKLDTGGKNILLDGRPVSEE